MKEIAKNMLEHPFFKDFNPAQVESFAECATSMHFPAGSHMFREEEVADRLFLVMEGMVTLELEMPGRDPLAIMSVGTGSIVGLSWLFQPSRWHFSARVRKDASVIALDARQLLQKCTEDYQAGYQLMWRSASIMGERLQATRAQLLSANC